VWFLQRRSCLGVDAPETKSPERLRGPGSGWAQCGYAGVVSTCTSFKIRIGCIPFFGKGADFSPLGMESQATRIILPMPTILGLPGSIRSASFNAALLRAAIEVAPSTVTIETASIAGIPLYNGDEEAASGIPEPVRALKDRIAAADGLLLVTPEYNNSIPGVFKNAIDWLSRPMSDIPRVFGGRAVAIMGATPGRGGTTLSQAAWLPVVRVLGMKPWYGRTLYVANAGSAFDKDGKLIDDSVRKQVVAFMAGFAEFVIRSA
jgi:NAD(P)H-dependent FMN reductase